MAESAQQLALMRRALSSVDPRTSDITGDPNAAQAIVDYPGQLIREGQDNNRQYLADVMAASKNPFDPSNDDAKQRIADRSLAVAASVGGNAPKPKALAMDEASRMARAKEMGFDTENALYHGTTADISEFNSKKNINGRAYGDGIYLTSRPTEASQYASVRDNYPDKDGNLGWKSGANVLPIYAKMENPFNLDHPANDEFKKLVLEEPGLSKSIKDKVRAADDNFSIYGYLINNLSSARFTDLLKKAGYDSLQAPHAKTSVVFDSPNIRSKFAEFDPKKSDSGNISAGIGIGGALGSAALADRLKPKEQSY